MIIVTGTGRSGTSLVVQLLSQLYNIDLKSSFNDKMDAGLEHPSIVRFNDLWSEGKVEEAVGWFISSIPFYKSIKLFKDPRFFYNHNLHYIKKHFPKLKVIWMYRDPSQVISSGKKLITNGQSEGQFWVDQNKENLELQNNYFKFYLEKNQIPYIKLKYPDLLTNKDFVYSSLTDFTPEFDSDKFNLVWDNLVKIK